jgi:hypothetical protein
VGTTFILKHFRGFQNPFLRLCPESHIQLANLNFKTVSFSDFGSRA